MTPAVVSGWSKSSLKDLLEGCSWQWALKRVYRLPEYGTPHTVAGVTYHAGIEHHERVRLVNERDGMSLPLPSLDELIAVSLEELLHECGTVPHRQWELHDLEPEDLAGWIERAYEHWWSTPIPEGQPGAGGSLRDRVMAWRPIAVEPWFSIELPTTIRKAHGFIDALYWDPDRQLYPVVDNKTAGNFGKWKLDASGHETEAATYVVGAEVARNLPVTPGRAVMEWHIVRKDQSTDPRFQGARVVTLELNAGLRDLYARQLWVADLKVEEGSYRTNPDWNLCREKWCPFFHECQVTGELAPGGSGLPVLSGAASGGGVAHA